MSLLTSWSKVKVTVDIESKLPAIVTIPIPDLPPNTQFVEFQYGGQTYRYPSRQAACTQSAVSNAPSDSTCSSPSSTEAPAQPTVSALASVAIVALDKPCSAPDDSTDSQEASSLPSLVADDEDDGSLDIADRLQEYCSKSSESLYSELSVEMGSALDASFWEVRACLPTISIEECEDPSAVDQDLNDTALTAALSMLNVTMDFLPVPPPSFNAPRPPPDPLSVLHDILELTGDAFDFSVTEHFLADSGPDFTDTCSKDDWTPAFSSTLPLRIVK